MSDFAITGLLMASLFLILEEITPAKEESIPRRTAQNDTAPAHSR